MALMTPKDRHEIGLAMRGYCPKCHKGRLYASPFSFAMKERCEQCGLNFSKNDNADGPAFFVMAILCFVVVPAALILDLQMQPPIWVHAVLWGGLTLVLSAAGVKPLNGWLLRQQYKHRPGDFED